ncbi:MAG: type II toxin-antitoxin system HicA family toxin [Phycisphaeraceae bacterium]|nr:MAG: type II toxin-antitoxin system HicA family toxin [Phycisphaeraceae bacterium]
MGTGNVRYDEARVNGFCLVSVTFLVTCVLYVGCAGSSRSWRERGRAESRGRCVLHTVCYSAGVNSREVIRRLVADGWVLARTKGSHHQYRHATKPGLVTVPHPKRDLPTGTLRSIAKQAGWSKP